MYDLIERKLNHPADFRVAYRFYPVDEGGRENLPFQGYRSDFWYGNTQPDTSLFMIWPEFEDDKGNVILDNLKPVSQYGTARMWIINPEMRVKHSKEIYLGTKCYFMEGPKRVAECTVIEILGLMSNPQKK